VIFREQIRYTVEEHFRKQARLMPQGIKVLSLFFLDRVDNYIGDKPLVRRLFDEAFDQIKNKFTEWTNRKADKVRAAYFAEKKRRGGAVELVDSTTGQNAEDRAAYNLIMRDKERLLSFEEPTAFIFSHSALREGWDNPNVAQICTLNQTVSEVKKRQEIGRGMRLFVTQAGDRVRDERVNVLTVVANESYELYVASLQAEMEEEFGKEGAAPRPVNARQKKAARRRTEIELTPEFKALWDKIKQKTRYRVTIDREKLLTDVVKVLDRLKIDPPRVVVTRAVVEATKDLYEARRLTMSKPVANLAGRFPLPNLVEIMADLMEHTTPPVRLSRATLLEIIRRTINKQAGLDNPQDFAVKAVQVIKEQVASQLVYGIQYEKIEDWFKMEQWEVEIETSADKMLPVERSIYDYIVCDSSIERDFVNALEHLEAVRLYLKLPNWFKVPTPVGNYNPDWAIVIEDRDEFGDTGGKPMLYLVRETKSTMSGAQLRDAEKQKVHCGERHFKGALGVDYKVVNNVNQLL
jgi:type III restriction enzyme